MVVAQFLLTLREGLEAALIVSILAVYLTRIGRRDLNRYAYLGSIAAVVASLAVGVAVVLTIRGIESPWAEAFEGFAALIAVAVLTYMIFWMARHAREIRGELHAKVDATIGRGRVAGIAALAFVAVFREGTETVLFLTPLAAVDLLGTAVGVLAGFIVVSLIAVAIFRGSARLGVRRFFTVTSILLIVFAAGLTAVGVHELNELYLLTGWGIPPVVAPLWDTSALLDENSPLGQVLKSLVGYNADPSLTEVLAYIAYWIVVGGVALRIYGTRQVRAAFRRLRDAIAGRPVRREASGDGPRNAA